MSKVTLTQEQADVLENIRADEQDYDLLNHWINKHAKNKIIFTDVFNLMTTAEFARAWIEGYEVEPQFKKGDVVVKNNGYAFRSGCFAEEIERVVRETIFLRFGSHTSKDNLRHATKLEKQLFELGRTETKLVEGDLITIEPRHVYIVLDKPTAETEMDEINLQIANYQLVDGEIKYIYPIENRIEV